MFDKILKSLGILLIALLVIVSGYTSYLVLKSEPKNETSKQSGLVCSLATTTPEPTCVTLLVSSTPIVLGTVYPTPVDEYAPPEIPDNDPTGISPTDEVEEPTEEPDDENECHKDCGNDDDDGDDDNGHGEDDDDSGDDDEHEDDDGEHSDDEHDDKDDKDSHKDKDKGH